VVEGIEGVHAELDGHVLPDAECFGERQVCGEEPRAGIGVDPGVAEVVESGVDEGTVAQRMGRAASAVEHAARVCLRIVCTRAGCHFMALARVSGPV